MKAVSRFFNERRSAEAIAAVNGRMLVKSLAALPPPERAAIMIVAHAMLRDAASSHGPALIEHPARVAKPVLQEFLARLGIAQRRLGASAESVSGRAADDPLLVSVLRQLRATEVVILTIGVVFDRSRLPDMRRMWKVLWAAREHAADAVRLLTEFERATQERSLPASQSRNPERMAKLATTLPPMFQTRKKPA